MTMEEKLIKKSEEQPVEKKKGYTPPTLTVYGKLTELTGSGVGTKSENKQTNPTKKP
jgi:hypothetical protein